MYVNDRLQDAKTQMVDCLGTLQMRGGIGEACAKSIEKVFKAAAEDPARNAEDVFERLGRYNWYRDRVRAYECLYRKSFSEREHKFFVKWVEIYLQELFEVSYWRE